MESIFKKCSVVTTSLFCLLLTIVIFSADNPAMLLGVLAVLLTIFLQTRSYAKLLRGLLLYIPFSLITITINMLFVWEGTIVLFEAFGKTFTLESLLYASILSVKLLLVIYVFMLLEVMVDSDRALSYFSAKAPKSTLMFMIALKLFPNMKQRLKSLREVYQLRGVDFDAKTMKDRIRSNTPILSILLENSLDGAFDIGEAAYVRGFLSQKRTIYDKQKFGAIDYLLLGESLALLGTFLSAKLRGMSGFEIYNGLNQVELINEGVLRTGAVFLILIMTLILYGNKRKREETPDEN